MFKFILLATLFASVLAQGNYHGDSRTAAIISEQRYLSGDGKFGAAYSQEDGINFKEETDSDGTRHGSYSYVDPSGQRRTISYTAGKNGFQASGDHLPVPPPAPPQVAPQPQYQPIPQYQPPAPQQYSQGRSSNYDDEGQYDPRYNDPNYNPQPYKAPSYQPPPPPPAYHHQPSPPAPQYSHNFQHQPSYNPPPPVPSAPVPHYTTQNPNRFFPPGKLSLNRTPDGFSYSFNKVK